MTVRALLLAGLLGPVALSGAARADTFADLRAGCAPAMTVQREDCSVENIRICPDGRRYHETLDPDGSVTGELSDADYDLVFSADIASGEGIQGILETRSPISLRQLLETGSTSGDYLVSLLLVFLDPRPARATFDLALTDETLRIDGVAFRVADAHLTLEIGMGGQAADMDGRVLIDTSRGLLVTDEGTIRFAGATDTTGDAVTGVILPGQAGFMPDGVPSACQGLLSLATPQPEPSHG